MPSAGRFRRGEGFISKSVEERGISVPHETLNAVDFIESHRGLGVRLFPVQRLIIKCVFGVPMDYKEKKVPLYDVFRERLLSTVLESEALHIFHEEGRALEVNEPIPTPDGFRKMGDLKVGDIVFSADGTPTEVDGAQEPFLADTYRLSFDDGTSVLAHGNHLWETSSQKEKHHRYIYGYRQKPITYRSTSIRTTVELMSSLKVKSGKEEIANHAIRLPLPIELPARSLPIDPYCLGVWLGDGHSAQAIITGEEKDCLEILQSFSAAGFESGRLGKFWWGIYGLWPILKRTKLLRNKHIPDDYLWSSASQRLALLQGLMDSDGGCSKRGQTEFSNTNRLLSEGVYMLAASFGLKPGWSEKEPSAKDKRKYRVRWTSPFPVFRLKRKLARLQDAKAKSKRHYRYVTSIEPAGMAMVRCISVKHPSGLFLFGNNFNVTHNCNIGDWRDIPERGYNEACVIAGRRGGKLLSVDEAIPTPLGFVRNGDLKDGDRVFGEDGKAYHVLMAHPIVEEEAFRVSFDDGTFTYAHAGHLWRTYTQGERKNLLRRIPPREMPVVPPGKCRCGCGRDAPVSPRNELRRGVKGGDTLGFVRGHQLRMPRFSPPIQGGIRTTEEVQATLQANHAIPLTLPIDLPDAKLLLDPYCLGYWLGDGNSDCGILTISPADAPEVLSCFAAAGYTWHRNKDNPTRWHILGLPLRSLGVLDNKHIPFDYLWASRGQRLALLQGLCDSDGHCAGDGQVEFCNTNKDLAEGVYQLASSLGAKPFFHEGRACLHGKDCGPKYRVTWTGQLPAFHLKRKLARLPKKVKATQRWRYIKSVEPAGKMRMRCITTDNPTGLYLFGKNFNVTHNSQLVSAMAAYKLYLLLNFRSPQEYFDLVPNSHIDFTFLAQDEEGSDRLYDKLREDVNRAPFFAPFFKAGTGTWMGFITESDRGKRDVTPTVNVDSHPCTTRSVRSPSSLMLALDEFAHFRSEKGSTSDEVYQAATPSTLNFHHAELLNGSWISQEQMKHLDPPQYREFQDSLIVSISSPWTKVGKMYDLHRLALDKGKDSSIFTLRVSTAEMNPTVLPKILHEEHEKSPMTFRAEYGGQFLDSSETYVTEATIRACTDVRYTEGPDPKPIPETGRLNLTVFAPSCIGRQYFWGLDLGMMRNATALAIGHLEHVGGKNPLMLVYDYIDRMMVGERFEGPGVEAVPGTTKYVGYRALPLEDIVLWLRALNRVMPCFRGATDQHGGQQLVQLLEINEIYNVELLNLTTIINSQMAFALKGYMDNTRCRFPYVPRFMHELRTVEAEYVGKYQIRVQAPPEKGATDDMCDAAEEVAYVAQKWLMEEGGLHVDPSGASLAIQEQMQKPPAPLMSLDGVSMTDIKVIERMHRLQRGLMMSPGTVVVANPFHRRTRVR